MITLDAGKVNGGGSYLRTALVLATILQKPVTIQNFAMDRLFQGLSADKIALIHALATATDARLEGVTPGSTRIVFVPSHPWSKKKIALGLQGSISLALQGLLLPALFSRQKVRFHLTGQTHGKNAPTITYLQHVFFRYVHALVEQLSLKENAFGFSPEGDVEVIVKGRVNRLPPLQITGGENLAGIRLELAASKDYLHFEMLTHLENFAKLMHPQIRVVTRYTSTQKSGIAAGIFAFYGDDYGFDNDKPFIMGDDAVWTGLLKHAELEQNLSLFVKQFLDGLDEPGLDEFCADQLIMLLALVGGAVKVKAVTDRVKANIAAAEVISGTIFRVKDNIITATPHVDAL
ncbi:RNA 3'-terminal phosphate cyclase [Candidatus Woesearchaeota archaeon]|nr:RNA 3'-terminal phosphate cyclase [Candidatus Woesearchaeota archaeon]